MFKISGQHLQSRRDGVQGTSKEKILQPNFLRNFVCHFTVLYCFGGMRVSIRNGVVGRTTLGQNLYSLLAIIGMTMASALHVTLYYEKFSGKDTLVLITNDFGCFMQYSCFLSIMLFGKYTEREKNVQIYYMLQDIDRVLEIENIKYYSNFLFGVAITVTIVMLSAFTFGYIIHSYFLIQILYTFYTMPFCFGMLICYFDITFGTGMMIYLILRIRHLNGYVKVTALGDNPKQEQTKRTGIYKTIMSLIIPDIVLSGNVLRQEKWIESLKLIINSYRVIVDIYSISILMNTLIILVWTFICIGIVVSGSKSDIFPPICSILYIIWAVEYYTLMTATAIYNDWFLSEIKNMKLTCVRVMSKDSTGQFYKTASEMFRAIHHAKLEFDLYGIFVFTSMIPLQLLGVVTSNMLVLVQFIIES